MNAVLSLQNCVTVLTWLVCIVAPIAFLRLVALVGNGAYFLCAGEWFTDEEKSCFCAVKKRMKNYAAISKVLSVAGH